MISLWIVRHGETDWNTQERVQGWTDIPLNDIGVEQAHALGRCLQGIPFHTVMASDLQRAATTAQIIASYTRNKVQSDERLRERMFGSAEGMIRAEARVLFGGDAPDAEPLEHVDSRASAFLEWVVQRYTNTRIACVTHGGFVRAILRSTFHQDVASPPNTSVTRLQWNGKTWSLLEVGSTWHLVQAPFRQEI